MAKYHYLFSPVVYSFLIGGFWCSEQSLLIVAASAGTVDGGDDSSTTTMSCLIGWNGNSEKAIPKEWINDGYCDCPFDGKDESDTNACSGSLSWAGIDAATSDRPVTESNFVCPQQPNLVLPVSRLHDGICDCCDGSDEDPGHSETTRSDRTIANPCKDDCYVVLRAEREKQDQLKKDFLIGSKKREADIVKFIHLCDKNSGEAFKINREMSGLQSKIEQIRDTQILGLKESYVSSRLTTMTESVVGGPMATALLSSLGNEELEALLVHICQIAGEIAKSDERDDGESTCLALRVAALDLGLVWNDPEDYEGGTKATFHNSNASDIVQIVFENALAKEDSNDFPLLRWKLSSSKKGRTPKGRRRLDEIDDDFQYGDNYYSSMHDDSLEQMDDDDNHMDVEREDSEASGEEKRGGKEKELIDEIRESLFSVTRATFLIESQEILNEIASKLLSIPPQENDDDDDEESNKSDKPEAGEATFDQTAYTMLRNNLQEKRAIAEKGFRWGASARHLLGTSSISSRQILERLVIGTIFYGQISALQVWQIFQAILPEYKVLSSRFNKNDEEAETTCASSWARNCPPKHVYRESPEGFDAAAAVPGFVEYPPSFLLEVAAAFCDEEASTFGKEGNLACLTASSNNSIGDFTELLASLPSGESHSFFEYAVPTERNQDSDPLRTMFEPISNLPFDVQGLRSLEVEIDAKETKYKTLQETSNRLWKEIGGKDGNLLGKDGEFHSIADQCFEVVAGKYTYELCLFGNAYQKDGNSKTNLGKYETHEYKDNNGGDSTSTRVLKWTNGAKCWNGPNRSATVHVTCGPNHKVVSANEPNTCMYVFEMESYLACDEEYRLKMGL